MRIKILTLLIVFLIIFSINAKGEKKGILVINSHSNENDDLQININTSNLNRENKDSLILNPKITFTKNCGQIENEEIFFYDQNNRIWFTNDGIWYEFREEITINKQQVQIEAPVSKFIDDPYPTPTEYKRLIIKQEFSNANDVIPRGIRKLDYFSNFFYGNVSKNWIVNVPIYQDIFYEN
ncbi:MAG: hypothetical protein ACFFG0_28280, partial [Candidatus Thorarchaeota archaeon]